MSKIITKEDYEKALQRIEELIDTSPENDSVTMRELCYLSEITSQYEDKNYPRFDMDEGINE